MFLKPSHAILKSMEWLLCQLCLPVSIAFKTCCLFRSFRLNIEQFINLIPRSTFSFLSSSSPIPQLRIPRLSYIRSSQGFGLASLLSSPTLSPSLLYTRCNSFPTSIRLQNLPNTFTVSPSVPHVCPFKIGNMQAPIIKHEPLYHLATHRHKDYRSKA